MLMRALASVMGQTRQPDQIVVSIDHEGIGSAANRNRALESATGEWTAFLDDDDTLLPQHIARLLETAEETGADLVYPIFGGINTDGVFYVDHDGAMVSPFGLPFDEQLRECILTTGNFIPVTVLARTEFVRGCGGFAPLADDPHADQCDDWSLWQRMLKTGAVFAHLPEVTWRWEGHEHHTSGKRWQDVYGTP